MTLWVGMDTITTVNGTASTTAATVLEAQLLPLLLLQVAFPSTKSDLCRRPSHWLHW